MQVIDPALVRAIIVLNAHRVDSESGEGFCVRLCRESSSFRGLVAGFTEDAPALTSGFGRVEKVMKGLHVRRLAVWPRFREEVKACLGRRAPEVVEVQQDLSAAQKAIQGALADIMERCLRELRRSNRIDASDLTLRR